MFSFLFRALHVFILFFKVYFCGDIDAVLVPKHFVVYSEILFFSFFTEQAPFSKGNKRLVLDPPPRYFSPSSPFVAI